MIEFRNIYKTFNKGLINETVVFEDFSLKIEAEEFVSIVGSNGCGKSTLLNILCGQIAVDSGQILIDGKDVTHQSEYKRAEVIGRVFQDPLKGTCGSMTIEENMALADNKNKPYNLTKAVRQERCLYYSDVLKVLEMGIENKLHVKVGSLSGGQRQALSLILACIRENRILILDEHTAALDPKTSSTIMKLTDSLVETTTPKLTAMMVTHNLEDAITHGTRLVMLRQGKVVLDISGEEKKNFGIDQLFSLFHAPTSK